MYIPAVRSIPLLEKKGEFQGEAGASTNSLYINGCYAFTDNIAVAINGNLSYRNFSNSYDLFTHKNTKYSGGGYFNMPDLSGKFAHRYGEVSMGRINIFPIFPMKLEIFGGMGMGRATDIDFFQYKSDYYSFFGQGNFGVKKRMVEAGGSLRLVCSVFNYVAKNNDKKVVFEDWFGAIHLEPMIFARLGWKNFKFVFRVGLNIAIPIDLDKESSKYRGFDPLIGKWEDTPYHFSVGISYRISGKKLQNKDTGNASYQKVVQ
jgi:uncharacterized membrane protein YhdT